MLRYSPPSAALPSTRVREHVQMCKIAASTLSPSATTLCWSLPPPSTTRATTPQRGWVRAQDCKGLQTMSGVTALSKHPTTPDVPKPRCSPVPCASKANQSPQIYLLKPEE